MRLVFWWRQNGRRATRASRDPDRRERSSFQEVGATDAASSRLGSAPRNDPSVFAMESPFHVGNNLRFGQSRPMGVEEAPEGFDNRLLLIGYPAVAHQLVQAVGKRIGALNVERLHIRIVRWAQSRRQHRRAARHDGRRGVIAASRPEGRGSHCRALSRQARAGLRRSPVCARNGRQQRLRSVV